MAFIGLLDNVGESGILDFHTYRSCGRCKERFLVGNYSCSVPELIANHFGGLQSPIRVTNCSPLTIVVDLNDTPTNVILVFWRDKADVIFFQKEKGKQRKKLREGKEIITNLQCLLCRLATSFVRATNVLWAYRKRKYPALKLFRSGENFFNLFSVYFQIMDLEHCCREQNIFT